MAADGGALPSTFTEFAGRHLTWVLSLLPFLLVGIMMLRNADGDAEEFRFMLQNANIVQLLMASVVPLIPVAVFWLYAMIFEWLIITCRDQRIVNFPEWIYAPSFGGFIL